MKRLEGRKHGVNVVIPVEESRRLLEPLVPELMPQDSDTNELLTDEQRLLDEGCRMVSHLVHDRERRATTGGRGVLGGDGEGIDERLGVRLADVGEDVLDELADVGARRVDASDEL